MGPGTFLSHRSAAALWGLAPGTAARSTSRRRGGRQVRPGRQGIQVHRCKFEPESRAAAKSPCATGSPCPTVARTLFDLAERSAPYELKGAWDEASRLRILRVPEVVAIYERRPGRRRARAGASGPFSSPSSATSNTPPHRSRIALPRSSSPTGCRRHRPTCSSSGDEVDVLWPDARLIVELDSWEFHAHRAAFEKDRDRDTDHLLAGYRTIRVTHRRLSDEPEWLAAQIRALLIQSAPPRARAASRPRSPRSRSGFRRPARPLLRARLSSPGRCPRSRR